MKNIEEQINTAVQIIKNGGLVAFPTDTVYCLAADIFNEDAVGRVYEVKQRPRDMALPVIVADLEQLMRICRVSPLALFLAEEFFPAGFTLVLPKLRVLPDIVTAGKDSVAVRIQSHPVTTTIIKKLERGVIGTSANIHGLKSPITGEEVRQQLNNKVDFIIDGTCRGGIESTIVDVIGGRIDILREGAVSKSRIEIAWKKFLKKQKT